jgi:hypothetical protein
VCHALHRQEPWLQPNHLTPLEITLLPLPFLPKAPPLKTRQSGLKCSPGRHGVCVLVAVSSKMLKEAGGLQKF